MDKGACPSVVDQKIARERLARISTSAKLRREVAFRTPFANFFDEKADEFLFMNCGFAIAAAKVEYNDDSSSNKSVDLHLTDPVSTRSLRAGHTFRVVTEFSCHAHR